MIIWIDGTPGIGKSSVAAMIRAKRETSQIEFIDPDEFTDQLYNMVFCGGSTSFQTNITFLNWFKDYIETKLIKDRRVIVVNMNVSTPECKELLIEPLKSKFDVRHFILSASEKTILERIEGDKGRDKPFARDKISSNMEFYRSNYQDAVFVNTDGISVSEIADTIISCSGLDGAIK